MKAPNIVVVVSLYLFLLIGVSKSYTKEEINQICEETSLDRTALKNYLKCQIALGVLETKYSLDLNLLFKLRSTSVKELTNGLNFDELNNLPLIIRDTKEFELRVKTFDKKYHNDLKKWLPPCSRLSYRELSSTATKLGKKHVNRDELYQDLTKKSGLVKMLSNVWF